MVVPSASYYANDYDSNDDNKDCGDYGHDKVKMRQDYLESLFGGKSAAADLARGRNST